MARLDAASLLGVLFLWVIAIDVRVAAAPPAAPPYERLATMISNPYGRDGLQLNEPLRDYKEVPRTLDELKSCSDPVVAAAAREIIAGRKDVAGIRESSNKDVDRGNQELMETTVAALRGDYVRTESRPIVDDDGRIIRYEEVEVDGGNDVVAAQAFKQGLSAIYRAPVADAAALARTELHRMAAWKGLEQQLPKYYPEARVAADLVSISIVQPDSTHQKPGRFMAVNNSGRRLTKVQLRIDLAHYETYPESNTRQLYYIPVWEAGETLHFATKLNPNLVTGTHSKPVPLEGPVIDRKHPNPDAWIRGIGGVVQALVEVWSEQAHQLEQTTRFDENAKAGGAFELKQVRHRVASWMHGENRRNPWNQAHTVRREPGFIPARVDPDANDQTKVAFKLTMPSALERVDRILAFAPADSNEYQLAQGFKKDPQSSVIDWSRQQLAELNQLIKSHRTFVKSLTDVQTTPTRCAVNMSLTPFDSDGRNSDAKIWLADNPSDACKFSGNVEYDATTQGPIIRYSNIDKNIEVNPRAQLKTAQKSNTPQHRSIRDEFDFRFGANIVLTPDENGFKVQGSALSIGLVGSRSATAEAASATGNPVIFIQQHKPGGPSTGESLTIDQLVRADANGASKVLREGRIGTMRAASVVTDGTILLFETDDSDLVDPNVSRTALSEKRIQQGVANRGMQKPGAAMPKKMTRQM